MIDKKMPQLDWEKQQTPLEGEVEPKDASLKARELANKYYKENKDKRPKSKTK